MKERLAQLAADPIPIPARELEKYFLEDVERWAKLVREGKVSRLE